MGRPAVVGLNPAGNAPSNQRFLTHRDEALSKLAATNEMAARLVNLRYFAGLTNREAAVALGVSPRKADQIWAYARVWLLAEMGENATGADPSVSWSPAAEKTVRNSRPDGALIDRSQYEEFSMSEQTIFTDVLERDPAERAAFLDEACGDDSQLRGRVENLLQLHENAGSFLERPAVAASATLDRPLAEKSGTQIGPYKLREQIGEGGFGTVYVAEQTQPVARKVALKIIKPGMDSRDIIARFEAERQALALMDHPNVAKVFDAGSTESGRP